MVVRITFLKKCQKPLYCLAAGGKDGETNQDEQNPLKDGEK